MPVNQLLFLLCMILHLSWRKIFEASNNELITDKKYLGWAVWKVALQLLQQDEAILLPKVTFRLLPDVSIENFYKMHPPTNQRLLSSISYQNFGIVCKHKRYGTLLYRKNGDLLKSLSKALGNPQRTS